MNEKSINDIVDQYFSIQELIFDHVGYVEDWRILPLDDCREMYWRLYGEGPGTLRMSGSEGLLDNPLELYNECDIYTQRHLPKWVYRGPVLTLVVADTRVDGNKLLILLSNDRERPETSASGAQP